MESLDDMIIAALNAKFDKQSAALDKSVELLAVLTRVAEETLQPLVPPKMSGDAGPSDRGVTDGPSSMQGSANAFAAGSEPKRADVPPVAPMSELGMHTLNVTTADTVAVDPFGPRHVAGLTAQGLHTEYGARVSRRGGQRKVGKRYSSDPTGDGPSARAQRKRARNHLQEHESLYHVDGSFCTEEEQVAQAMALSETDGSPSPAPTPAPTSTPIPAPPPAPHVSLLVIITAQSVSVHAPAATLALAPASGDSSDVEVVPGPQRPVAELANITDDHSDSGVADGDSDTCKVAIVGNEDDDVSGGSSDDHDEVVDTSDVEVVGGADAELRFPALAPTPPSPPPPPPLST